MSSGTVVRGTVVQIGESSFPSWAIAEKIGDAMGSDTCSAVIDGPRVWVKDRASGKIFQISVSSVYDIDRVDPRVLRAFESLEAEPEPESRREPDLPPLPKA